MFVVLVEDDPYIAQSILAALDYLNVSVEHVDTAKAADYFIRNSAVDLCLLDLGLPDQDGLDLLNTWRKDQIHVPVLVLTARNQTQQCVDALNIGADDYLAKPFSFLELLTRMEVRLNSRFPQKNTIIRKGPFSVDDARHEITFENEKLDLTPTEYKLMCLLFDNVNIVISKETIMNQVWGYDYFSSSNVVEVYIRNLREKLHDSAHRYIKTERGFGYKLDVEGS